MIAALRERLGWRAARVAALGRRPAPASGARLLLVLPEDPDGQAAGWTFVRRLDLPTPSVAVVVAGERIDSPPDRFAGSVDLLDAQACDWRGRPRAAATARAWSPTPSVAVNLARPSNWAAAFLVGGAPAEIRIGPDTPRAPELYDLSTPRLAMADGPLDARALLDVLARLRPSLLPLRR